MHVSCWVLEGVVEALLLYWAGCADESGDGYVGDVFVLAGEHEVGGAFAFGFVVPAGWLYSGVSGVFFYCWRELCVVVWCTVCGFFGWVLLGHLSVVTQLMHPLGMVMPCV